ncbi:phenazine biosynthesis protein [Pseudomonas aeruginosa VRFPA05]|nr:phenazine biosynthesis protein [Pseudomonas aeruginosa VRFPA05]
MGVNANISESLTGTIEAPFPEFEAPPANPMEVLRNWLERARRYGVREPRALALATVDGQGRPSTRIVVIAELGERGVVFATHADSQKGRELAQNPWASGVLYWRESSQQIILNGRAERLPDERADAQWLSRPYQTHPMSIASRQSETLADIHALRAEARRLAETDGPLPRPPGYCPRPSSGALRRRSARPRGVGWLSAQRSRRSNGCRRALSRRSRKRAINWAINSESPPAPKKSCSTPSDGLSSTSRQSASSAFSSSSAGACATPCRRSTWGWRAKPVRALRSILPLPVTGRRSSTRNCAGSM